MTVKPLFAAVLISLAAAQAPASAAGSSDAATLARGRYLVQVGGCNDCHTPRYPESAGDVAQDAWLVGSSLGWQGPWGTTYAANLRLAVQRMTEEQWISRVTNPMRPPMPWFNLKAMSDTDRRAVYRYIRSLGPAGEASPAYAPPGTAVSTPVVVFPGPPQAAAQKQAAR